VDIENKLYQLAIEIFGIDFQKYSNETGRKLLGVLINPEKKEFQHLFGDFPDNLLPTINKKFNDSVAGYKVDIGSHFTDLNISADIFLLNINNLNDNDTELESLLIHELCHMVMDSGILSDTNISSGKKDKYHGIKLYKKTDARNEDITKHTEGFCILLSTVSGIASSKYEIFKDRWDVINNAMRYDLKANLRQ